MHFICSGQMLPLFSFPLLRSLHVGYTWIQHSLAGPGGLECPLQRLFVPLAVKGLSLTLLPPLCPCFAAVQDSGDRNPAWDVLQNSLLCSTSPCASVLCPALCLCTALTKLKPSPFPASPSLARAAAKGPGLPWKQGWLRCTEGVLQFPGLSRPELHQDVAVTHPGLLPAAHSPPCSSLKTSAGNEGKENPFPAWNSSSFPGLSPGDASPHQGHPAWVLRGAESSSEPLCFKTGRA